MTKVCSVCATENKDDAQFCRSCGTSFTASPPANPTTAPAVPPGAAKENVCGECGFQNKPGIRYCANCGMSLTTAASGFGDLSKSPAPTTGATEPSAGHGPPPITYHSFAPVAPYSTAAGPATSEGALFDELDAPDAADPDPEIAARQNMAAERYAPPIESGFSSPDEVVETVPNRGRTIAIAVAAALVVLGAAAWWFMGISSSTSPAESAAAPAPAVLVAPTPTPTPAAEAVASAPEPAPAVADAASAPPAAIEAAASAPEEPTVTSATTSSGTVSNPPPAAAAPLPQTLPPAAAAPLPRHVDVAPADAQAKRAVADKARRDKAARDKADREAKAMAQREQAAASAKSEQDAQARRRTEEAQRARAAAAPAPAPAPAAALQPRGVREICAGRGTIAEAVCQSRQCAAAEHANDPICRRIREADDRRRNLQN